MHCEDILSRHTSLGGPTWSIWASLRQGCCEMQDYRRARRAIGALWVTCLMIVQHSNTYLIVRCNQLCHCFKNPSPRELAWTHHRCEVQQLLPFLLRHNASLCYRFLFLHSLPNGSQNCPMVYWYVVLVTFLLVQCEMLTYMKTAG